MNFSFGKTRDQIKPAADDSAVLQACWRVLPCQHRHPGATAQPRQSDILLHTVGPAQAVMAAP